MESFKKELKNGLVYAEWTEKVVQYNPKLKVYGVYVTDRSDAIEFFDGTERKVYDNVGEWVPWWLWKMNNNE